MKHGIVALDSGAVIAIANQDAHGTHLLAALVNQENLIIIPTPVLSETLHGGQRDAKVHRILNIAKIVDLSATSARDAGRRLGAARSTATVDAMIVATAIEHRANAIVTTDPDDITRLVAGAMDVIV